MGRTESGRAARKDPQQTATKITLERHQEKIRDLMEYRTKIHPKDSFIFDDI